MTSDNIDTLQAYEYPFSGVCDRCGAERTLFYETESGERLCNDCKKPFFDDLRDRGLGLDAIEIIENDPDNPSAETTTNESATDYITDHLHEIFPKSGQRDDTFELEYDRVNWEAVSQRNIVGEDDIITAGRYTNLEVDATGFEAMRIYLDINSQHNEVYLTDDAVYVFDHILSDDSGITQYKVEQEAGTALCELSLDGQIEGLKPADHRPPPRNALFEHVQFSDKITSIEIPSEQQSDEEYVVYAVSTNTNVSEAQLLKELRTHYGINYTQPDRVEIVESEDAFPNTKRE